MSEPTPTIVIESHPNAVRNNGRMDRVRKGQRLTIAQRESGANPTSGWAIQNELGQWIAGAKWPIGAAPVEGTLLVTRTTPPDPGNQAVKITYFEGEFTPANH